MKLDSTRVKLAVALMILAALPSFGAAKRRAVNHPGPSNPFTATIKGTVLDDATGAPVTGATVQFINSKVTTAKDGTFEINNVSGFGNNIPVNVSRTGYTPSSQTVNGTGTFTLTFRLKSRPTVSVRLTNGTTKQLDDDSIRIGYVVVFSGYITSASPNFCKSDGTKAPVNISDMKRITGPAVLVRNAACCTREDADMQRIHVELKSGAADDLIFTDSCSGYTFDLLGKEHVSGDQVFYKFSEIAEVVFP